ncbi:MAG: T9SS type A sorting domain-containing protein [Chitinophagaceae bacterium]|nr:MAG: T9SS type A sorting domain-containing protein [Chitinophagaceae bacterium]
MKRTATLLALLCASAFSAFSQGPPGPASQTVTISSINTTVCAGNYFKIYFNVSAPFDAGNMFSFELSDQNGSFATPTVMRTISGRGNGVVSAPVPEDAVGSGYRVRIVSTAPAGTSMDNGMDIRVNELPGIEAGENHIFCPSVNAATPAFIGSAATYTWVNDNTSIGLAASGSGPSLPAFNTSNNTTSMALAHVKVTAVSNDGCRSKAMGFRISVYPRATVNFIAPIIACRGTLIFPTVLTGTVPGTTFTWSAPNGLQVGLPFTSGTNIIPPFITINNQPAGPVNAELTVTTVGPGGCAGGSTGSFILVNDCGTQPAGTGGDANTLRSALSVGPNPAIGDIRLTYSGNARRLTVEVRDANGQTAIAAQQINSNFITLNTGRLFAGSYFAVVTDVATGVQTSVPFVKL